MKFEELTKNNKLPKAEDLETNFDMELKDAKYLSKDILIKIDEKFDVFCSQIQDIIHADSSMESLYEVDFLNEQDKQNLFNLFKELIAKRRIIHATLLTYNEKQNCDLINECFTLYQKNKPLLAETFLKLARKWENNEKQKENDDKQYFG